jgi:hypothetical protein
VTARTSPAEADAKARLRASAQREQELMLAAVRAGEQITLARAREQDVARAAAVQVQQAVRAHATAVVELAAEVGDDRAAFVLGLTPKEFQMHRRAAATKPTPDRARTSSFRPSMPAPSAHPELIASTRTGPVTDPALFGGDLEAVGSKIIPARPLAPGVSAAGAADTPR